MPTVDEGGAGVNRPLAADQIGWRLDDPPPRPESLDLLMLDERELLTYARALQREAAILRDLLHEALTVAHTANVQRGRMQARIAALVTEVRQARAEARALAAQVRRRTVA